MEAKKILFCFLSIICLVFSSVALASCGEQPTETPTEQPTQQPTNEPHVHEWNEGEIVDNATCTEAGLIAFKCKTCEETKLDVISALGHTEVIDAAVAATCTKTGLTEGKHCSDCGEVFIYQQATPAKDHAYTAVVTEPTCTTIGYTTHTCDCGKSYVDSYVAALGHTYIDYVCSDCDHHYYTDGLEFTLTEDGENYKVRLGTATDTDIVIPAVYEGKPVLIDNRAFLLCESLTSVIIGNGITNIGDMAFSCCRSLTSVTIPDSVKIISYSAFFGCWALENIEIPDSVTSIGITPFGNCSSLTSIVVDSKNSFYDSRNNCNAIIETKTNTLIAGCKDTIIPDSVTSIGEYAFQFCDTLISIVIPDSVTSIDIGAFGNCISLTTVYYTGTEEQWNSITIGSNNDHLTNANIIYNYKG